MIMSSVDMWGLWWLLININLSILIICKNAQSIINTKSNTTADHPLISTKKKIKNFKERSEYLKMYGTIYLFKNFKYQNLNNFITKRKNSGLHA